MYFIVTVYFSDVTGDMVGQYLKSHPEYLETWLMDQVDLETLERWMIRRTQRDKQKSQDGANGKIQIHNF